MKTKCRKIFNGGNALFEACWRKYLKYRFSLNIDIVTVDVDVVAEVLETFAAEMVNNPKSRYYIHG